MDRHGRGVAAWLVVVGIGLLAPGPGSGGLTAQDAEAEAAAPSDGARLVRALGCGSCHQGVPGADEARRRAPSFGPDGVPLAPDFVYTYLADPGRRRPEIAPGRMPDFGLSERERVALALYLAGEPGSGEAVAARSRHPELVAADGERLFRALNCSACHARPGVEPWRDAPDLSRESARVRRPWLERYLASPRTIRPAGHRPGLGSRMPDFGLNGAEVEAVAGYLASLSSPGPEPTALEEPPTPFRARRTERLVRRRLSCLGCHSLEGDGGRIGPALDGVGERLTPSFLRAMIHRPREAVPGARMPTPLYAAEELDEVARWLAHRGQGDGWEGSVPVEELALEGGGMVRRAASGTQAPPVGNISPEAGASMAESDSVALYGRWCAHCHGPSGRSDGWNARYLDATPTPHAADTLMARRPDDTLFDGIYAGAWVLDGSPRMPAFGRTLSRDQIRSLVGYIRTLCDCLGPEWSRDGARSPGGRP